MRRRMQLSVNRKLTAVWWMGMWTVRVHAGRFNVNEVRTQLKAHEGVEKSCTSVRRKRGQRKGRRRSRGGKPRPIPPPPTPNSAVSRPRHMARLLRALEWHDKVCKKFRKLFEESDLFRKISVATRWYDEYLVPYRRWSLMWGLLRERCGAIPFLRPMWSVSWEAWLDERYKIRLGGSPHSYIGMSEELKLLGRRVLRNTRDTRIHKATGVLSGISGNRSHMRARESVSPPRTVLRGRSSVFPIYRPSAPKPNIFILPDVRRT
jgi:hypothetical protein